MNKIKID